MQAGCLVVGDEVVRHVWPDGPPSDPRAIYNRVKRLRERIADLPLHLHTVRGKGLLLELD